MATVASPLLTPPPAAGAPGDPAAEAWVPWETVKRRSRIALGCFAVALVAGSIGGLLAARLAANGERVTVVARGEHLRAIAANGLRLITDEGEPLDTTKYTYSALVGSLLYLSVCTRPDIAQAVGALAKYMAKPTTVHWQAATGVLRYVNTTKSYG